MWRLVTKHCEIICMSQWAEILVLVIFFLCETIMKTKLVAAPQDNTALSQQDYCWIGGLIFTHLIKQPCGRQLLYVCWIINQLPICCTAMETKVDNRQAPSSQLSHMWTWGKAKTKASLNAWFWCSIPEEPPGPRWPDYKGHRNNGIVGATLVELSCFHFSPSFKRWSPAWHQNHILTQRHMCDSVGTQVAFRPCPLVHSKLPCGDSWSIFSPVSAQIARIPGENSNTELRAGRPKLSQKVYQWTSLWQ